MEAQGNFLKTTRLVIKKHTPVSVIGTQKDQQFINLSIPSNKKYSLTISNNQQYFSIADSNDRESI